MIARILTFPLILVLTGLAALAMFIPALHALVNEDHSVSRSFAYSGILGMTFVMIVGLAMSGRQRGGPSDQQNLLSLFLAFSVLPLFLAVPFFEGLETTSFLNAYTEMVSCITTTGATLFEDPRRLGDTLHLWRGMVGWAGGLMIWVSASAVLAPLNLGGFEVTATAEPGQGDVVTGRFERATAARRILLISLQLAPIYIGLTGALWLLLLIGGDRPMVCADPCHVDPGN